MIFSRKTSLTWGKRLLAVFLIMCALFYGVLLLAEQYKDPVRKGLEDALAEATGKRVVITDMTTVKMVPDVVMRMTGINITDPADPKKTLAHADKAYFSMPSWRMFLGLHGYAGMEIQNLQLATGYVFPKKLDLDFAGISDPNPDKATASFIVDGIYNNLPLLLTAEMARKTSGKRFLYDFNDAFPISFKLGELEADGIFERGITYVSLKQIQIVRGSHRAEFVLKNMKAKPVRGIAEGTIEGIDFNGVLSQSGDTVVFSITPKSTKADDIKKIDTFVALIDKDTGYESNTDKFRIEVVKAAELETNDTKPQETDKK